MTKRITPEYSDSIFEGIEIPSDAVVRKQTQIAKRELNGWHEKNIAKSRDPQYRQLKTEKNIQRWNNTSEQKRKEFGKKISRTLRDKSDGYYIVRSPGNDLLDFYDHKWRELQDKINSRSDAQNNVGLVPPSVVYRIRYVEVYEKNKKAQRIKEILKDYVDLSKQNKLYYMGMEKTAHKWLTNKPHEEWRFETKTDAYDFVQKKTKQNVDRLPIKQNDGIMWTRDRARGWSIVWSAK